MQNMKLKQKPTKKDIQFFKEIDKVFEKYRSKT